MNYYHSRIKKCLKSVSSDDARLKVAVHVIVRRDSGREFQMVGPETQNTLSPNLVLVLGTMKSVVSAKRSLLRDRSRLTGSVTSLMYAQLWTCCCVPRASIVPICTRLGTVSLKCNNLRGQVTVMQNNKTLLQHPKARFPLPELTGSQHGPSIRLVETRARQHGPCWRVMETGHPSTQAVNSGSGNRA